MHKAFVADFNESLDCQSETYIEDELMPKFQKHIFVCGNYRAPEHPRGCCDPDQEAALQKRFKKRLAEMGLHGKVRANQAGCLDQCEHGPNVVIYPDGVWYGNVQLEDVDEIVESHIIGGVPVERLLIKETCLNTTCEHKQRRSEKRMNG